MSYLIKDLPMKERPRERMKELGKQALSTDELIAILLRTGSKDSSATTLAKRILDHLNNLLDLNNIEVEELMQIKGIKLAKAATIVAAIELGYRLQNYQRQEITVIKNYYDIYQLVYQDLEYRKQEHFIVIYLNTKGEIIKKETIFIGTINQTLIHPREIFKLAIKLSSASIVLVHNHPSGDSSPSSADVRVTKQLLKVSELIGIAILDHIIIGNKEFYSIMNNIKKHL